MPKPVQQQYPELLHYTTAAGLTGILTSGCVWASHASFLNDAEEITHFFDARLIDIVREVVIDYARELAKAPEVAAKMIAQGGVERVAQTEADGLAARLREATLAFNQPYIFSMSAPRAARIAQSGLLSQWRGYGTDGGYALVLDTARLNDLLQLEVRAYHYLHAQWGDVHYHGVERDPQPSTEDVAESEAVLRSGIAALIRGGTVEETPWFYQAISGLSCLYKHWGFWEEGEVRVVAIPATSDIAALAAEEGDTRPSRQSKAFIRGGIPVPYIDLFSNVPGRPAQLPIKRVIVGPHRDKSLRADATRRLLQQNGYDAEVVCSEIPYIGR